MESNEFVPSMPDLSEAGPRSRLHHQFCLLMRGVHYSACSLCYKKIAQFHQKCSLMRDCSLFRRLLLPEYTVCNISWLPTHQVLNR